jgi:phosphatidylethanolamine/phosphatidyl-N-methylethanolamine N-methyltransferase
VRHFNFFFLQFGKLTTTLHSIYEKTICTYKNTHAFLKTWLKDPSYMGAIAPSSSYLAKAMVSHISTTHPGIIIELGAGTGVVTQALLQSGILSHNLIVLERSPELASRIRQRFPYTRVIQGDAIDLQTFLQNESRPIHCIISSLPLRSLPKLTTDTILQQVANILGSGGKYIQFTYGIKKGLFPFQDYFQLVASKRIWRNLPPARVDVWEAN